MAGIATHHPDYDIIWPDWQRMRDVVAGERAVKIRDIIYLPSPTGFSAMPDRGHTAYSAYKLRAQFPNITAPTIRGMAGVIHRTEIDVKLPAALEPMRQKATPDGLTLEGLHRLITREILTTGRFGLLADIVDGEETPVLAGYRAEAIIGWSKWSDFYALDETQLVRDPEEYSYYETVKYRELMLNDSGSYTIRTYEGDEESQEITEEIQPSLRGGGALDSIPFIIIGSTGIANDIDEVPLMGVANCALAAYRLDADYRHQLYMSGQETLFCYGVTDDQKPSIVGAHVIVNFTDPNSKAAYVGPAAVGINAHRQAIEDETAKAVLAGAKLLDTSKGSRESGDALRIRYAAETATLVSISQAVGAGLERALKHAAVFMGANPDEVIVKPNLSFIDTTLLATDAVALVSVWQGGAISKQTLYQNLQRGEIASSERTYEEEEALIQDEMPGQAALVPPQHHGEQTGPDVAATPGGDTAAGSTFGAPGTTSGLSAPGGLAP